MAEEEKKPNFGKRNKSAGHRWELDLIKRLKLIGFKHIASSRAVSKLRDAQKVDICNTDESIHGRLPYNIQAKTYAKNIAYPKILSEMPKGDEINVVLLKQTERVGDKFRPTGTYAILPMDHFFRVMEKLVKLEAEKGLPLDTIETLKAS